MIPNFIFLLIPQMRQPSVGFLHKYFCLFPFCESLHFNRAPSVIMDEGLITWARQFTQVATPPRDRFPLSQELLLLRAGWGLMSSSPLHYRLLSGLILCRSYAGDHNVAVQEDNPVKKTFLPLYSHPLGFPFSSSFGWGGAFSFLMFLSIGEGGIDVKIKKQTNQ